MKILGKWNNHESPPNSAQSKHNQAPHMTAATSFLFAAWKVTFLSFYSPFSVPFYLFFFFRFSIKYEFKIISIFILKFWFIIKGWNVGRKEEIEFGVGGWDERVKKGEGWGKKMERFNSFLTFILLLLFFLLFFFTTENI